MVDPWAWLAVLPVVAVVALSIWAVRRQARLYPAGRPRLGDGERPEREPPWPGIIHRGGHG